MFAEEKMFIVARPKKNQNDPLYAHASTKKKDVATKLQRTQLTFSQSLMASVSESKVVDITQILHLLITKSRPLRPTVVS